MVDDSAPPVPPGRHRRLAHLLSHPVWYAAGLLGLTALLAAVALAGLRLEGDIAKALKGRATAYAEFLDFEARFGAPSEDEVFMVEASDFGAESTFTALEDLVLDLTLTDGVLGVISVFSVPDPEGEVASYLSRSDLARLGAAARLDRMLAQAPLARQVMSADRTTTLIAVLPDRTLPFDARQSRLDAALATAGPGLAITPIGLTALQRTIVAALISDLLFLMPMALAICLIMTLILFRSWRAALVCTVPPVLGLTWTFGAMAALGIVFTPFLSIAPVVLIVLGVSDSIHAFNAIARRCADMPVAGAIAEGLVETLPAMAMTTLTTVLAFASLRIVGSPTLSDLALVGSFGLGLMLIAVVLAVPVASQLLLHDGAIVRPLVSFASVGRMAVALLPRHRAVAVVSLAVLAGLALIQTRSEAGFTAMEHVPERSEVRRGFATLDQKLPGSDQLFVVIEAADPTPEVTKPDRVRLRAASLALYGAARVLPEATAGLPADNAAVRRYLGRDHTAIALPVPSRLTDDWTETIARANRVRADLAAAGLGEVSTVTGYMLMASVEVPNLISEMRTAFYLAVGLVTLLAALLLRSLALALVVLVPNLIPILGVEAWLVFSGLPLTLTGAIGLTISFGIALDDTIHLLNRLRLSGATLTRPTRAQVSGAIRETVPPILTTSLVLVAGLGLTAFSAMPSTALFGQLVAGATCLALLADLFLLPSLLACRNADD